MKNRPTNPVSWSSRPISRLAKPMKLTISPTVIWPSRDSTAPTAKITTMTMVAEARVRMVSSAHQARTGYCAARSWRIRPWSCEASVARRA